MARAVRKPLQFPFRVQAAVALAAALSLWGAVEHFGFETEYQKQSRDPYRIAAQAERLQGVRAATSDNAILGYITDAEPGSVTASAMLNAAQYVLAPRLLRQDAGQDFTLGNFTRPADYAAAGAKYGLRVERDFGAGVVLYRKEGPK